MHRSLAAQLLVLLAAVLVSTPIPGATPRATSHGAGDVYFYEDHPATSPSGALTIEAWVRVESQEGEAWLVAKGGAAGWRLGLRDRTPFIAGGAVSFTAPDPLPLRQWCHVAGIWGADGSLSIVVDGKLAGTSGPRPGNVVPTSGGPLAIGDAGGDGAIREYALDEVRLWTVARDVKDIGNTRFEEVRSGQGLLAAFPLGGGREAIHGLPGSLSGTSTITPCGILPSSLEVPFAAAPPVLDGDIAPLEYRRPEECVLRYHDPTAPGDATVRLVHTATDLFLAVEGLRMPAEQGASPSFWVAIDPDPRTPFALQIELAQFAPRFYRMSEDGTFVPCSEAAGDCPGPGELGVKPRDECEGGVCTTTIEVRLAKTLLGGADEVGIAIAHVGYRQGDTKIRSLTTTPDGVDTSRPETWARAGLAPESPGAVESGGERAFLDVTAAALPRFCELFECPERRFGEPDPAAEPAPGFALFVDFYEYRIIHPVGTPYFRPGDWELRVEDPLGNVPGLPLALTEFREEPLGGQNDLIGDGIGEGVKLFFSAPPDAWRAMQDRKLDLVVTNHTGHTEREGGYPIRALSLDEHRTEICPSHDEPWWVHLVIQQHNLYFSESPFFPGMTREIHVLGGVGERPSTTFYAAIVSNLPEGEAEEYYVQGWWFGARLTGDLEMVEATIGGTVSIESNFTMVRDFTPPERINPYTGLQQGQGFVATNMQDRDGVQGPEDIPSIGTSTILAVTVRASEPLCTTCVVRGELVWQDGMMGQDPRTGAINVSLYNHLSIRGQSYFSCSLVGVEITFRPGWIPALVPLPGGPPVTIPGLDLSDAPSICEIIECPQPSSGARPDGAGGGAPGPDFEPGFSLFFPFTDLEIRHPAGVPFFQPGDWDLRVWDPDGKITPIHLSVFREDLIDRGSGIVGDEPGEGVVLFFAFPPGFAEAATGANLHLDVANRTLGTPREGSYRLDAIGYGAMPRQGSSGSFRRGDSNGDAEVDLSDALRTLGYLFLGAPPPDCPDAADANDDARIDISDAVGTLGFLFLGSAAPPAPGPFECGADPTGDALGACAPCPGA